MRAIVQDRYGSADVLEFRDVHEPAVGDDDVLARVRAAGCGPDVWHLMAGMPYMARPTIGLRRPKVRMRGWDVAGTVDAVGANVTRFAPGDQVLGTAEQGSFAELASTPADKLVAKPAGLSFEQAAALPISGVTALRAVRDEGKGAARPDRARHRRVGRSGFARRADRQGARREGHRGVQHIEGGPRPLDRRRT